MRTSSEHYMHKWKISVVPNGGGGGIGCKPLYTFLLNGFLS